MILRFFGEIHYALWLAGALLFIDLYALLIHFKEID